MHQCHHDVGKEARTTGRLAPPAMEKKLMSRCREYGIAVVLRLFHRRPW